MEIKIKRANQENLEYIAKIFLEESSKKPYNQNYTPKTIKERVKNMFNFGSIYMAYVKKEIIGFIAIAGEGKDDIYIDKFWIKVEHQRNGIGKKLLEFIENLYKKKGAKTISVMTSRKAGAFNFYTKFSFKENEEEVILKKEL